MSVAKKISVCVILLITAVLSLSAETHVVEKGETFYSISRSYGITVDELLKANNLEQGAVLKAGQKLTVPGDETPATSSVSTENYTVAKGDTLYSIARKNGTTVDEVRSLNGFTEATVLKVGQVIKLPGGSATSEIQTAAATQTVTTTTITATATASAGAAITLSTQSDPRTYEAGKKGDTSLVWPVKASEVVYITGKISGVALTAAKNEAVNAIHKGTVMFSGVYRGFGKVVFVQDDKGYIYVYAGLDSVSVSKGDDVAYGTKIGVTGTDALSGKSQINLMVYDNGKIIDPAKAPRG
ncbi:MAG: M23 family metallopeptidase [Treponema sp.]|nr:M23 family metallopeptidase [Candidatus Treponema caballi]